MLELFASRTAMHWTNIERSSHTENVTTENIWIFELEVQGDIDFPSHAILGFLQRDQFNQQQQKNDFFKPTVKNAQVIIGSGKVPDAGTDCDHDIKQYSPAYGEYVSFFEHVAEVIIFQKYITQNDFTASNDHPESNPCYKLHVFDTLQHQDFSSAQSIKVRSDLIPAVEAATKLLGYALLLKNKTKPISTDGQRQTNLN